MKTSYKAYSNIVSHLSTIPFEAGGILGGYNGIITEFYFDDEDNSGHDFYIPNVCSLNSKIME